MKKTKLMSKVAVLGVSVACCFAITGCSAQNYGFTGGTAATVKASGTDTAAEIAEDTVTKYIQDFRTSANVTSDDAWGEWLNSNSYEPSTVRTQVIDHYTEQELVKQACAQKGITVDSSEVDEKISAMKANYDSDEAWNEALKNAGTSEDSYRESIEAGLLEQKLKENVVGTVKVSDKALLKSLKSYATYLNGAKRSSHILFESGDKATAKKVLKQINSGKISFEKAAKKYSKDSSSATKGGDVGWDAINNFVTEYTDALGKLKKGQVSKLVKSDYGYHIIKCTDVLKTTGKESSVSDYPDAIVDYVRDLDKSSKETTKYNKWYEKFKEQAEITVNDMPENVPYNLDMSKCQSSDESSESSDGSKDSDESSSDTSDKTDSNSSKSADSDK
ncbi:MAG: peptidylprolyl isomerase [Coriobacteriia bacterium]|nr:peptidylprolyl isomerase [Coriobacteriia bacterium]